MGAPSSPDLLSLHGVRILGMADTAAVARRYALELPVVDEYLLDAEASGWVSRAAFADLAGWSLTDAGRQEDERRLRVELDEQAGRADVAEVHTEFVRLNTRFLSAITNWQLRPTPRDPMAANDHTDHRWDDRVLDALVGLGRSLRPLVDRLTRVLARFDGYADRFDVAMSRVEDGQRSWVTGTGIDSCHTVWFQLHEDLLATLGLERGQGAVQRP